MELSAVLCNYAEVQNNLLYITGGGVDRANVPPGLTAPYVIGVSIGITLSVPWTQTNQQHKLEMDLVDEDDQPVVVPTGEAEEPLHAELQFNVGRPPILEAGEAQNISLAINLPGLPLPRLGRYFFVLSVDGTELRRLTYKVATQQGLTIPGGPAGLPRLP
ncbi:hypothetical protein SAMN04489867_0418 [Pedococcus dokdonensis]|uniref:Uncharacterized protein n=1 Tax=Pedococcus dokdonensis TaxID=443156 RepID=A0A1H0LWC7_9MICO|nr:hypothetical protein [Pedococcus dokdonensis]SDO72435.1 hypothetical protein SAMN04489867_0418 [Pedococcus dokdonensis]